MSHSVIKTPLFTDHPEKLKFFQDKDVWVYPEEIAEVMIDLCEMEEHAGGTILEVSAGGRVRKVEMLNDPGPSGPGTTASNEMAGTEEVKALIEQDKTGRKK